MHVHFIYEPCDTVSFSFDRRPPKKKTPRPASFGFSALFPSSPSTLAHSWFEPQPEHERSHIGCASAHGHARAIERPHIALDISHAPIAPYEDDLRQARAEVGRRARCGAAAAHVDVRRNKYDVSELRTFSKRWVRRGRTRTRKKQWGGCSARGQFCLLCAGRRQSYDDGWVAWNARRGRKKDKNAR